MTSIHSKGYGSSLFATNYFHLFIRRFFMIRKDISTITHGVIMHQVNCQNKMGAGVAKALYNTYPQVKTEYHQIAYQPQFNTPQKRFGLLQHVKITDDLVIFNSFSQLDYGRNKSIKYTDEEVLMTNLQRFDEYAKYHHLPAYVPERIGCGLANGNWSTIKTFIETETDIIIVGL